MVRAFILGLVCAVGSVAPVRATSMTVGEIWSIDVVYEQHGCFSSRRDALRFVVEHEEQTTS